ncbi:MAG TPA: glycosyltransferase [Steroidobacteraceae bacterium]|nr:glycosyltransferase [Steroidobacteraceae bacterium]
MALTLASLAFLTWAYLLLGRGFFWRIRPAATLAGAAAGRVIAVIPARNERASIGATVESLLRQHFAGTLHVVVVDDGSSDGTAQAATDAAAAAAGSERVRIIRGAALPPGWTGKLWALSQGVAVAEGLAPDFLLFTDADIAHEPGSVAGLVGRAQADRRDLVSRMVLLETGSGAERLLIPAFVFFFFMLYPPAWVASARHRLAAAAGGCVLIRPAMLQRIGGVQAIRGRIIDDCALAQAVKDAGGRTWIEATQHTRSLRRYVTAAEIETMIARTAFAQLRHSWALLGVTVVGLAVTFLAPVALALVAGGAAAWIAGAAWVLMSLCYLPTVRFYRLPAPWCVSLPVSAVLYLKATVLSAWRYAHGAGGRWKDRVQDVTG